MALWIWLLIAIGTGVLVGIVAWALMTGAVDTLGTDTFGDLIAQAIGIGLAVVFVGGIATYTVIDIAEWTGLVHHDRRPSRSSVGKGCDANYAGACLDPDASDYDCAGGSGDGPNYTGMVTVVGSDVYGLDRDGDGIGCQ